MVYSLSLPLLIIKTKKEGWGGGGYKMFLKITGNVCSLNSFAREFPNVINAYG